MGGEAEVEVEVEVEDWYVLFVRFGGWGAIWTERERRRKGRRRDVYRFV